MARPPKWSLTAATASARRGGVAARRVAGRGRGVAAGAAEGAAAEVVAHRGDGLDKAGVDGDAPVGRGEAQDARKGLDGAGREPAAAAAHAPPPGLAAAGEAQR